MILIVDDDNAVRMAMGLMLKQAGMDWMAASTEAEALTAVRTHNPEIVILDMNLTLGTTGRQGLELLRKIKVLAPECEVLLISAWGTIPLAVEGMNHGAADFITKPWQNSDVLLKIKSLQNAKTLKREQTAPTLTELERHAITEALRKCDGQLSAAASMLGITRQALYRRLEKYGLK
ncbi:MAG: DNA-binding response regulator [Paramuribaculum sp.]|nr:DNA-binding response regulator [Paramuribaculum sp.]